MKEEYSNLSQHLCQQSKKNLRNTFAKTTILLLSTMLTLQTVCYAQNCESTWTDKELGTKYYKIPGRVVKDCGEELNKCGKVSGSEYKMCDKKYDACTQATPTKCWTDLKLLDKANPDTICFTLYLGLFYQGKMIKNCGEEWSKCGASSGPLYEFCNSALDICNKGTVPLCWPTNF